MSLERCFLDEISLDEIEFDCGVPELNTALLEQALSYHTRKYITTTLVKDGDKVIAFFSLMNIQIDLQEVHFFL